MDNRMSLFDSSSTIFGDLNSVADRSPTLVEHSGPLLYSQAQTALGPYPIDPNLIAQGVPPDDRVTFGDYVFGPLEGTTPTAPQPPGPRGATLPAARSAFSTNVFRGPSLAVAHYDPRTGRFATPDGKVYQQTDRHH
jgi:hypothetical protein